MSHEKCLLVCLLKRDLDGAATADAATAAMVKRRDWCMLAVVRWSTERNVRSERLREGSGAT